MSLFPPAEELITESCWVPTVLCNLFPSVVAMSSSNIDHPFKNAPNIGRTPTAASRRVVAANRSASLHGSHVSRVVLWKSCTSFQKGGNFGSLTTNFAPAIGASVRRRTANGHWVSSLAPRIVSHLCSAGAAGIHKQSINLANKWSGKEKLHRFVVGRAIVERDSQ